VVGDLPPTLLGLARAGQRAGPLCRAALAAHCADAGRDIAEIEFSFGSYCLIRDDPAEAGRVLAASLAANGEAFEPAAATDFTGPPELIAERWRPYLELGFTNLIIDLPAPYDRETIERLPEVRDLLARR
jgi:alkanesulfonate monooxygenase SsuD/methylene tetrahydromethanopterin reductase-like flavin-dependent oxidoreductase (luciferase family)